MLVGYPFEPIRWCVKVRAVWGNGGGGKQLFLKGVRAVIKWVDSRFPLHKFLNVIGLKLVSRN